MKQKRILTICMTAVCALISEYGSVASAETKVTLNDFYRPFELSEITPKNMQSWPYYRYTSMNWDAYGLFGTVPVMGAKNPAKLKVADTPFDIERELRKSWTFVESLTSTQTKGFLVLKDNVGRCFAARYPAENTFWVQSSFPECAVQNTILFRLQSWAKCLSQSLLFSASIKLPPS